MAYAKHFGDTWAGRVFSQAVTPLGLAIPIYTDTALCGAGVCALPLWNPPGSGVNVELIRVDIGFGNPNATAAAFGSVGLMAGSVNSIGSASGLSALAATVPMNGFFFAGTNSRVSSSNSAGTTTATAGVATAPVAGIPGAGWVRTIWDINLEKGTTTAHGTAIHTYDFDGTILVPPGVLIYLAATLASVALYSSAIVWKEIPITR